MAERSAVAEVFDHPPGCSLVRISTVNEKWASFRTRKTTRRCRRIAGEGMQFVRNRGTRANPRWRNQWGGSAFDCADTPVPEEVLRNLRAPCMD